MMRGSFFVRIGLGVAITALLFACAPTNISAADNNFALQVSPSPLVTTLKPGETKTVEIKIRNASTEAETLKIEARTFTFRSSDGSIALDDTLTPAFTNWLELPSPGYTVQPGEWQTQRITIHLPENTGFSYSFALIISRVSAPTSVTHGRLLKGSVAVFTLINVDRPDAVKKLEISSITTDQHIYEFLPSTVTVRVKNTGNTIARPYGNIYIQRGETGDPLATLAVNDTQAYILPGTERNLTANWSDGFPVYTTNTDASGKSSTTLNWDLDHLRKFRFGQYTAKVVAVYNDGTRDVPIVGEVTFWVIPWKAILGLVLAIGALVWLSRWYMKKRTAKAVQKALNAQQAQKDAGQKDETKL